MTHQHSGEQVEAGKRWTIWRPILESQTLPGGLRVGVWNFGEPPEKPGAVLKDAEFETEELMPVSEHEGILDEVRALLSDRELSAEEICDRIEKEVG